MKPRRMSFVTLGVLVLIALTASVASAQDSVQQGESADLILPTNATGNYDSGFKQVDVHMEEQTENKSSRQTGEPQPKQPREKTPQPYQDYAMPVKAADAPASAPAPSPAPSPAPAPKELPKTGGSSAASLFSLGAGALLVASGLLVRRLIR
jgi:LPXTG-motif cell wall-anchored protein